MACNSEGKRTSLENFAGQVTTTAWDCCHKVSETESDGSTTTWAYDDEGRMIATSRLIPLDMTNVTWLTTCYRYDALGRLVSTSADFEPTTEYTYDTLGNRIATTRTVGRGDPTAPQEEFVPQFDDDGNQTLVQTSTYIWQIQYNGENRPILWSCIQSNNSNNPNNQTISMSFDRMGRREMKNAQRFVYNGCLQIANFEHQTSNCPAPAYFNN